MRHIVIGSVNSKNKIAKAELFDGMIEKKGDEKEMIAFAKKELIKFTEFCGEGACIRLESKDGVSFYQYDNQDGEIEEYETTLDEFAYTHWFYEPHFDFSGESKNEAKRTKKQEDQFLAEHRKAVMLRKTPEEQVMHHVKSVIDEMKEYTEKYKKEVLS